MTNIVTALSCKRSRLFEWKRELQTEYFKKIEDIDKEIEQVNNAMALLNEAVKDYICPYCEGDGEVRYTDAAGSRDYKTCPYCNGTGVKDVVMTTKLGEQKND